MESDRTDVRALAERVDDLGTETAFAAAAEAAAAAATGQKVYPFHLGDLNIPTPANITEAALRAIRDGKTGYCPNGGIAPLREAIAADVGAARGLAYGPDNVSVQPGGKPVIGKFLLTLMDPGDEVLYPDPGFPIYSSLIEFFGGVATPYAYEERGDGFGFDLDALAAAIGPRTRLLILNDLHNPTGGECSPAELERVAELAQRHDLWVLSDEAYFDVRYSGGRSRSIAALPGMQERTVILYTFSKKYAMTGWRLGAAIGPQAVIDVITTLNVNVESCTNHFVQAAGVEALTGDQSGAQAILAELERRRDAACDALNACPGITCLRPETTFYLYPNVSEAMALTGLTAYEDFRRAVLAATGVSMCTRLHFGPELPGETKRYLRFAYSGLEVERIDEGLAALRAFLEDRA
jgi:aspartate/methionine/tyrosine aminotransferase